MGVQKEEEVSTERNALLESSGSAADSHDEITRIALAYKNDQKSVSDEDKMKLMQTIKSQARRVAKNYTRKKPNIGWHILQTIEEFRNDSVVKVLKALSTFRDDENTSFKAWAWIVLLNDLFSRLRKYTIIIDDDEEHAEKVSSQAAPAVAREDDIEFAWNDWNNVDPVTRATIVTLADAWRYLPLDIRTPWLIGANLPEDFPGEELVDLKRREILDLLSVAFASSDRSLGRPALNRRIREFEVWVRRQEEDVRSRMMASLSGRKTDSFSDSDP